MPLPGARYRVKTTKTGKRIRLAFKGGEVVEAKNIDTGETTEDDPEPLPKKKKKKKRPMHAGSIAGMLSSRFRAYQFKKGE